MPEGTCCVDGCERTIRARQMCKPHYEAWLQERRGFVPCQTDGCDRAAQWAGICRSCNRRADYQRNKQRYIARAAEWAADNVEKARKAKREHQRRLRAEDPELARRRTRESMKRWADAHPEEKRVRAAAEREKHAERYRQKARAWQRANPERARAAGRNREAKKRANGGHFSFADWQAALEQTGHGCFYCGITTEPLQRDHVIPIARGGIHDPSNIVPACGPCNRRKAANSEQEFRERYAEWLTARSASMSMDSSN